MSASGEHGIATAPTTPDAVSGSTADTGVTEIESSSKSTFAVPAETSAIEIDVLSADRREGERPLGVPGIDRRHAYRHGIDGFATDLIDEGKFSAHGRTTGSRFTDPVGDAVKGSAFGVELLTHGSAHRRAAGIEDDVLTAVDGRKRDLGRNRAIGPGDRSRTRVDFPTANGIGITFGKVDGRSCLGSLRRFETAVRELAGQAHRTRCRRRQQSCQLRQALPATMQALVRREYHGPMAVT